MNINELRDEIHENAVAHGRWDEERHFGSLVALMHSELSEALEEYRYKKPLIYFSCNLDGVSEDDQCDDINHDCHFRTGGDICEKMKPEGIAIELIDCVIRIFDYCGKVGIDVEKAIKMKHEYNKTRPYRHGGKKI